jgi:hypothetical protein
VDGGLLDECILRRKLLVEAPRVSPTALLRSATLTLVPRSRKSREEVSRTLWRFSCACACEQDMEQLKSEFEKENPNISVNFIQMAENDLNSAVCGLSG